MLVETINVCKMHPHIFVCSDLMLSHRTWAMLNACLVLRGNPAEQMYRVKPNSPFADQYPNMVVIPTIH